jgi:putative tryptophan/tyrosine transport system substrate-binding protein
VRRREFIAGLGSAAAWPLVASAQQSGRIRRVGLLMYADENDPDMKARLSGFTQSFAELGWIDGRSLRMDVRWTHRSACLCSKQCAWG